MLTLTTRLTRVAAFLAALLVLPSLASAAEPIDHEFDLYWGEKRDITNIHKRAFMKDGRHEFALFFGVIPNDDFFTYIPLGLRYDYHVTEDIAIELAGSYLIKENSELEDFIETQILDNNAIAVELPQFLEWQAGAGVLWSPIYGKFGAFATKVAHFDFGIELGLMALGTRVQPEGKAEAKARVDVGGNVGATLRFYVHEFVALRIDYRHYFYAARDADDNNRGLSYPLEISFGVSFFTPEPK